MIAFRLLIDGVPVDFAAPSERAALAVVARLTAEGRRVSVIAAL